MQKQVQKNKQELEKIPVPNINLDLTKVDQKLLKLCKDKIRGFSNQIFAYYNCGDKRKIQIPFLNFYIPAYMRIKIKNIKKVEISELSAELNINIILTIKTGGLSEEYIDIIKKNIKLSFRRDSPTILREGKNSELVISSDDKKSEITFLVRKIVSTRVNPFIFLTPLEVLDLILSISINPIMKLIKAKEKEKEKKKEKTIQHYVKFNFNFMKPFIDTQNQNICISMSFVRKLAFASYKIAQRRLVAEYTSNQYPQSLKELKKNFYNFKVLQYCTNSNENVDKKQLENLILKEKEGEKSIDLPYSLNHSHFHVPLFKQPVVPVFVIYIPLIILSILNVTIFYQDTESLADRLANIATILIALVGMISIVREEIPPNPSITLTEIMVILESIGALLCLLSSVLIHNKYPGYYPYELMNDKALVIAIILAGAIATFPTIILLAYLPLRQAHLLQFNQDATEKVNFDCFWNYNEQADNSFYKLFSSVKKKAILPKDGGCLVQQDSNNLLFFHFSDVQNVKERHQLMFQSIKNNYQIEKLSKNLNMTEYRYREAERKFIQSKMMEFNDKNYQRFKNNIEQVIKSK